MNTLLLLGSLAAARRRDSEAMHGITRGFAAYVILVSSGLIAVGFFTAGGFLYITSMWAATTASTIIGALYPVLGGFCFLEIRVPSTGFFFSQGQLTAYASPPIGTVGAVSRDSSGSMFAIGLAVALGYFVGLSMSSMTSRR